MASRPILERGGAVVCIVEQLAVLGTTEEMAVHACAPSLWSYAEFFVASVR